MQNRAQTRSEVAVIVPCYNVERYVRRALDSVFVQTYRDFHVYTVDDSSTDTTLQLLKAYTELSYISQPHAGPAAARNRAIKMSDSTFIAFLDADDEWLPLKLERQISLLKQDPSLGLVCSLCSISDSGNEPHTFFSADGIPHSGKLFRHLVRNCFVFTPTVVVRRSCLEEVGLFNESLAVCEDFNLWLRIAARWNIAFLPEVLASAYKRPGSLSVSTSTNEQLANGVAALEHVRSSCPQLSPPEISALRAALAERLYFHGSYLLSSGARRASRRNLKPALKLRPAHWQTLVKLALTFLPLHVTEFLTGIKRKLAPRSLSAEPSPVTSQNSSSL